MLVIFGCPPSSGSTVLQRILNSHPEIYAGPEFSIFDRSWFLEPTSTIEQFRTMLELEDYTLLDQSMGYTLKYNNGDTYFGLSSNGALTKVLEGFDNVKTLAEKSKDLKTFFEKVKKNILNHKF
jgi:hypothetical protein